MGKRCVYLFKGSKKVGGPKSKTQPGLMTRTRRIWGRVLKPHGKSGVVKCSFKPNLPGHAIGRKIKVYMYPSSI